MWMLLIFVLPFLGILIYVIARPRVEGGADSMMMRREAPPRMA
jgi:hypothetical protein